MNDSPLYNSRIIKPFIEYMEEYHPDVGIDTLLSYAGMTSYELEDKGHWFTQRQVDLFYEILVQKTENPGIARDVGRYTVFSQACGAIRQYVLGFMTPASAYHMLEKIASNLSRAHIFKTKKIGTNKLEVTVELKPGVKEKPYQCDNRLGMFESIVKLFTNKFAKIEHPSCFHKGAEVGCYIITWKKASALIWKLLRNYILLI